MLVVTQVVPSTRSSAVQGTYSACMRKPDGRLRSMTLIREGSGRVASCEGCEARICIIRLCLRLFVFARCSFDSLYPASRELPLVYLARSWQRSSCSNHHRILQSDIETLQMRVYVQKRCRLGRIESRYAVPR